MNSIIYLLKSQIFNIYLFIVTIIIIFDIIIVRGSKMSIIEVLFNDKKYYSLVSNPLGNKETFHEIHNYYKFIQDKNIELKNEMLTKLSFLDYIYNYFFVFLKFKNNPSLDTAQENLKTCISNMKEVDEIDSFYPYYRDISLVSERSKRFSLEEQYKTFPKDSDVYELNGVSLITPSQTISSYNTEEVDGKYSEYHDENFYRILHSVYLSDFENNYTGQDIKIRFINTSYKGTQIRGMTIEIPVPINSGQKKALEVLNEEIKSLSRNGININIEIALINENHTEFYNYKCSNLDDVFGILLIDDSKKYKYEEKVLIGKCNLDKLHVLKIK